MSRFLICLAASVALPVGAFAQSSPASTPKSAAPAAPAASATAALDGDTPIEALMATPNGKAAIEKVFPEIPGHAAYDQFKGMSLKQLQPLAGGIITDEKVAAFEAAVKGK